MSARADDRCPILTGRAWAFGFGVTAELIVPRLHWGRGPAAAHLMTAVDPAFPSRLERGDFLVGADDFSVGAVDDTPVRAMLDGGIAAVVAQSFDPCFARWAVELGLPAVAIHEALAIRTGAHLRIDLEGFRVVNLSSGDRYPIRNFDEELLERYRRTLAASRG